MMYYVASPYGHLAREFSDGPLGYTAEILYQGTNLSEAITISRLNGYPIYTFNSDCNRLIPVNLETHKFY